MLVVEHPVGHREGVRQKPDLIVMTGSRQVVGDFLEQRDIWRELPQHADDAFEAIPAIEPADALVNVPGNDSKSHGAVEVARSESDIVSY